MKPAWHPAITPGLMQYFYFRDNAMAKWMNKVSLALSEIKDHHSLLFQWTHTVPENSLSVYQTGVSPSQIHIFNQDVDSFNLGPPFHERNVFWKI